jgi:cysteinyl-tRNA synthetase
MGAYRILPFLKPSEKSSIDIESLESNCYEALDDDLNSAKLISQLMDGVRIIHSINFNNDSIDQTRHEKLKSIFKTFIEDILGLKDEFPGNNDMKLIGGLIDLLQKERKKAKASKDFAKSDEIRNEILKLGIEIKDTKDSFEWSYKK